MPNGCPTLRDFSTAFMYYSVLCASDQWLRVRYIWKMEPNSHSQSLTCSISDITDEDDVDINARMQMLSIVSGEDNPDGIAYAAAAGDVAIMVKHLEKFPGEVGAHVP